MSKLAVMKKNGKYYLKNKPVPVYWKDITTELNNSNITSANGWTATSSNTFDGYAFFKGQELSTGGTSRPLPAFTLKIPENHKGVTIKSMSLHISGQGDGVNVYDLYKNDILIQRVTFTVQQSTEETKTLSEPIVLTPDDTLKVVCISYAYNSGYWTSFWAKLNMDEIRAIELIPIKDNSTTKYEYTHDYQQPANPTGITATSGWGNPSHAFDYNSNSWAYCNSLTDYIQWDLGRDVYLTEVRTMGYWVSGQAVATALKVYSVYSNGNETLIGTTSGEANTSTYYTSASFDKVKVNKLRFYVTTIYSNAPSRTVEINIAGYVKEVVDNYDYETERNTYNAWLKV